VRRLVFNIHLCVALTAALFVAILGATGAVMAFEPELDHVLHWKMAYVEPRGAPMSLAAIGEAVAKSYPGERIAGYTFGGSPRFSDLVALRGRQVYVNPYTGAILGERPGGMDFLARVHQLHLRLLILRGDTGKRIVSWVGVAILFLALSGLYLWWPYRQVKVRRPLWTRRFWLDLHNAVGVSSFAFLLILGFTGVMIGFEETTVPLIYRITGSERMQLPRTFPAPPPGARPIGPDRAVDIARAAIPGAEPFQIGVPGPRGAYQIRSHFPEDLTPGGRSFVVVDQYSGKVLFAQGSRTAPAGTRIVNQNRAIHTGDIFGVPSKILMSLMSLALLAQAVSGVAMWWRRTRKKRS
jgi:uncharacterized iron-regulated membrane protein